MKSKFEFSPSQKEAIVEALEMRVEECQECHQCLVSASKAIREKAKATLAAIDRAEVEGYW